MAHDPPKAVLYLRTSDHRLTSDGQRKQDIQRQEVLLRSHCDRAGIIIGNTYWDEGRSAWTDDLNQRPAFKTLLNDVRRHYVKQIFIEDLTRWSRRLAPGLAWLKVCADAGCNVTSLREGEIEITSSKGWLQSSLMLMFGEWESRMMSEKIKSGMEKAKNLKKHIGRPRKDG